MMPAVMAPATLVCPAVGCLYNAMWSYGSPGRAQRPRRTLAVQDAAAAIFGGGPFTVR